MVSKAHVTESTWSRYDTGIMSFIAFHEECFGCLPSPPPFPLPPVRDWVGDLVERGVVSASNYVAALNKLQTGASAPSLRGDPHIARALP